MRLKSYTQPALFGHLSEGCEFKFQGYIWIRDNQEGANRRNSAGEGFMLDYIRSMEPVMISLD